MSRHTPVCFLCFLALSTPPVRAVEPPPAPFLVADLNRNPSHSGSAFAVPSDQTAGHLESVALGGILYFPATDPAHGTELWRSDGTPEGTWRVADINPGPTSSSPRHLTAGAGQIYFTANDSVWGEEVWSSDGTRAGTRLLRDICPGPCPSIPLAGAPMAAGNGRVFFVAWEAPGREELWASDGTREGTVRVSDGCAQCPQGIREIAAAPDGPGIFFTTVNGSDGQLWRSDGTPGGTSVFQPPADSGLTIRFPYSLTPAGSRLIFFDSQGVWSTDGSPAGTRLLRQGTFSLNSPPVVWNGRVFFSSHIGNVWVSDGTAAGTVLLESFSLTLPSLLTPSPCGVLFTARPLGLQLQVYRTRGTVGDLETISPVFDAGWIAEMQSTEERTFFTVVASSRSELWEVDGNTCHARRATDLCGPARACSNPAPYGLASVGGRAVFVLPTTDSGAELWRSDGTDSGTSLLREISFDPGSAGIPEIAALGAQVIFPARISNGTAGLWRSDGTVQGTRSVRGVPWPSNLTVVGDQLYFSSAAPLYPGSPWLRPKGLWRTDGTRVGTRAVAPALFDFRVIAQDGQTILFGASDSTDPFSGSGQELYATDGTSAGTRRVLDINQQIDRSPFGLAFVGSSDPGPAVRLQSFFLFAADDGLAGREPWRTDGTAAGTRLVADINPYRHQGSGITDEPTGSIQGPLVRLGSLAIFVADDGDSGPELWATDGTAPGTRRVMDLRPGSQGSSPHDLVPMGGRVYLFADDGTGEALWASDGTAAGTVRVAPLAYRGRPSWGRALTLAGGRLFFVVANDILGRELWTSDGTAAGTRLVRDIRPGPGGSYPQSLTAVDNLLVFAADDGTTGLEPWVSDGTPQGTRLLGDLAAGPDASTPGPFTAAGPYLFFSAWDSVHGRELWAVARSGLGVRPQ